MAGRIHAFDWSQTPIGSLAEWPQSLRTAVQIVLTTRFPTVLAWGPDLIVCAYNDEYRPLLGDKPDPLGRAIRDVWNEAREVIEPLLAKAMSGEAVFFKDAPFTLIRHGYPEETYFDFCYSPVRDEAGTVAGVLNTTVETTALVTAARRMQDSEERFRLIVENARNYAIFVTDPEFRILDWLPGAAAVFGWTGEEVTGQPAAVLFTPEDVQNDVPREEREKASRDGTAPDVRWHVRKTGERVFIDGVVTVLRDDKGGIRGFLKIGQDVTGRRRAEERLQSSERRLRTLAEGIPQLVFRAGERGERLWSSPQWKAYTGLGSAESFGSGWLDAVHPDDRIAIEEAWETAGPEGGFDVEHRIRQASDGAFRWFRTRATPVRDENDQILEWLGTSTDVHELRRLQDSQAVMVAELQHRTRNLIAVVRSIASQTMSAATSLEAFKVRFNDRLAALSRVQGLLSGSDREPITIRTLVWMELDALGAEEARDRIRLEGPDVTLRNFTVQTLALALHELATNARKYGALATEHGRIHVRWRLSKDPSDAPRVVLEWIEEGIKQRPDPGQPQRRGYGRELVERALPYSLGAQTLFELDDTGVRCIIDLPLSDRKGQREQTP